MMLCNDTLQVLGTTSGWRYILGFSFVPAVLQIVTLPFCPRSPRYLLLKLSKETEAVQGNHFYLSCETAECSVLDSMPLNVQLEVYKISQDLDKCFQIHNQSNYPQSNFGLHTNKVVPVFSVGNWAKHLTNLRRQKYHKLTITIYMTLMMTSAQVIETSVNVTNNSPSRDYSHPYNQTTQMTK